MRIYLCGTISTDPRTHSWRGALAERIRLAGHVPLNPMRYQNPETFSADGLSDASTPSSFFWKVDKGDLLRADVLVLVFWKGLKRQSIGTWAELGIASTRGIPILVVTDDPNVRDHPAIQQEAAIVIETVTEAWEWLRKLLVDGDH